MLVHGAEDAMLTPKIAVSLHEALLPHYRDAGSEQRLRLVIEPGMSHGWTRADNVGDLRRLIAAWFDRYLIATTVSQASASR
jgi:dipeptidyl aminopeptidase/acylaminoacyl peptidase